MRGGGRGAVSLTPDVDGTRVHIFESSQLEGSYILPVYINTGHLKALIWSERSRSNEKGNVVS